MVIVFLGPAGSGKDTQANLLSKELNIPNISTGQLFRDTIENGGVLAKFVSALINKGKLIPTELLTEMLLERIERKDAENGFILNGAPRTFEQVSFIDKAARFINQKVDFVFSLEVPLLETFNRLHKRAGVEKRADDADSKFILERLHLHYQDFEEIKQEYRDRGILHEIEGLGEIEEIHQRIWDVIKSKTDAA